MNFDDTRASLDDLEPTERLGPYHDLEDELLEQCLRVFDPSPTAIRPFDRDEAVARAKASRVERDGRGYNDDEWSGPIWEDEDRRLSAAEARFWLALALDTPFLEDGVQADLSYIDAVKPLSEDRSAASIVRQMVASDDEDEHIDKSYDMCWWGVFIDAHAGYSDMLEATIEHVHSDYVGEWIRATGPPPPEHHARVLELIDTFFEARSPEERRSHSFELLLNAVPHPKWIAWVVEDGAERGALYCTPLIRRVREPKLFRRMCELAREARSHPWEPDVYAWVARFGLSDLDGLFELVLRRDPSQYWEPLYARAFRIRDPEWVRLLQPLAERRKSAPIVEHYLQNEGINAVEGLLRLVDSRGKKRIWALDWLARLAEDPKRRLMIDARLEHHAKVRDAVAERLGAEPELSPGAEAWALLEEWAFQEDNAEATIARFAELATAHEVAKLGELLRARDAWPARWRGGHDVRKRAISALARVDLPAARRELHNLLDLHAEELRRHVRSELNLIRSRHGWSAEDFDDFAVPDLGLDERGERSFDYGAREIRLIMRGRNDTAFVDQSSQKQYTRLPPAKKTDDAMKVEHAREVWAHLKKPLVELFDEQNQRFERAMVAVRTWRVDDWMTRIVHHNLLGHLARRLVWRAKGDSGEATFRWSAEGDAHDAAFEPVDVATFDTVELAHPAGLPDLDLWTERFAELEVVQPFDQLGRRCLAEPTVEHGALLDGQRLAAQAVAGGWKLTGARWYRAPRLELHGADGEVACIELEYGIEISGTRRVKPNQREQTLVRFHASRNDVAIPSSELNPALRSELYCLLDAARI